jgi:diguanylate cyclase
MENEVSVNADQHTGTEITTGRQLIHIETVAQFVTSLAVGVGLLLIGLFAWLRSRYTRENAHQARHNLYQATHDALTGLPNRPQFAQRLNLALVAATGTGGSVGVVLLDLDRFKEVNDTLGHHTGDRLLQQVGPRISGVLRAGEFMARLGGDEFALLIATATTGVEALAEQQAVVRRILAALHVPFVIDDIALAVDGTAGLARYPQDGDTGDVLLQRADIAMYQAKTNHEALVVYDRMLDGYSPRKLTLLADLRQAVGRGELLVHYQPQIDIATLRVVGVEALVRWQHPVEGRLPPSEFVPLAESSGFVHELTRYVLDVAVGDAKAWEQAGRALEVSVNISARCLLDYGLPGTVSGILTAAGLPARWLKLEITETAMIADPFRAHEIINRLRHLGVALSIDDFGTGYTSLAYLRDLPVQELKIDQSFVMRMRTDRKDAIIVRTSVELAQRLGLDSVAEGVEDAQTLSALAALGCTTAQGYHLSRPLPAHDLASWIDNWNSTHRPPSIPYPGAPTATTTPKR